MANLFSKSNFIDEREKVMLCKEHGSSRPHAHEFLELVYVCAGHADQTIDGDKQSISAGDCFLIDMGMTHGFSNVSEDFSVINCLFVPSFLSAVTEDDAVFKELVAGAFTSVAYDLVPSYLFVNSGNAVGVGAIFAQMLDEYTHKRTAYLEVLQSLLKVVLITLFRSYGEISVPQIIGDVIEMVKSSSDKKISLEELSEALFFSPAYISRTFKKHTGKNLTDFIRETRMQAICNALTNSDDSVDKIMSDHGYGDKKSFYEQFNRLYGCTPAQFRINNRKK